MLSILFPCFIFLRSTDHDNIPYILLIAFVDLPQPQRKLSEAKDCSFVRYCVPAARKNSA